MPLVGNMPEHEIASMSEQCHNTYTKPIEIRTLDSNAPMRWLRKGVDDFKVSPLLSLFYGALYAGIGLILLAEGYQNPLYVYAFITLFFLVGPVIAVGLYCMSRHIEAGDKPSFGKGCTALCYNPVGIISFATVIGMLIVFWTIITAIVIALVFSDLIIASSLYETILANQTMVPLFVGILAATGLVFAIISFSISVISIPLMTHRKVDVITAISYSIQAVQKNPGIMLSWAMMIVTLMLIGFAFAFIGIAVALPIIGHATWHAYRDLVKDDELMTASECDIKAFPFFKGEI